MTYHFAKRIVTRSLISVLISALLLLPLNTAARPRAYPTDSSLDSGAQGLGQAIRRLGVVASVLHTGAHPDDEDSGLLAYLARGRQARTSYLSLTRGDGGQNIIGPELYESLGVIRTEEMLAARRLDGAGQFFTRAYDFGFSKSRDETLAKWDREAVLSDMVRVIRTYRPLVIVSAWSGTPSDGHGPHQAAGVLTLEAFRAAGDPARFPEQAAQGLRPWKALKLYHRYSERRQQREGAIEENILLINTGQFDPLLGRSYFEIAMEGRSLHRSQDQGAIQRRGPQYSRVKLIESLVQRNQKEKDIFDGIDTTLVGISRFAEGDAAARLKSWLAEAQKEADEARDRFNPFTPSTVSEPIARGLGIIREARAGLKDLSISDQSRFEIDFLLSQKERDFEAALTAAEGIVIDCLADDEVVIPGQAFNLNVAVYAGSQVKPLDVSLQLPEGWSAEPSKSGKTEADGRIVVQSDYKVSVSKGAETTGSYWLKMPRKADMFDPGPGGTGIEPLSPPALAARVALEIRGQKVEVTRPAQYRFADAALGEIRRELKVAPAVAVNISPGLLVAPVSSRPVEREVIVTLTNNSKAGVRGTLSLNKTIPSSVSPQQAIFELKREGERASFTFSVKVGPKVEEGLYSVSAVASVDGRDYLSGYQSISYPHIEPRFVYRQAMAKARALDVKVAPGLTVGYIEGAGDDFANALKRLGVEVATIDSRELATGDLGRYDVIVLGIRAYEVRQDLIANNRRVLEYVQQGGTVIVQYNKTEYAAGNFAPYAVKMRQTGMPDRVTDERAPVKLLDPAHPLFNFPNKITERDFEGWVQERGTYFLTEWDAQYKSLMSSHDPGEEPRLGGALIARYGRGSYIYTGYAWFRQLPEGVPGAYRLIANLVSYPKARATQSGEKNGRRSTRINADR